MRIFGEAVIRIWSLLAKKVPAGQNEETAVALDDRRFHEDTPQWS